MRPSLFHRGLAPRLIATALYGLMAFGAVSLLERSGAGRDAPPSGDISAPTASSPATRPATLCLEALRPVATWEIRVDGAPVTPQRSDEASWIAEVALTAESSLVVDATPAGDGPAGRNALRIRIAGTPVSRDQTFWCERLWSVTTRAGQLAEAAAPIDPADLP